MWPHPYSTCEPLYSYVLLSIRDSREREEQVHRQPPREGAATEEEGEIERKGAASQLRSVVPTSTSARDYSIRNVEEQERRPRLAVDQ
jgi:hypothetical protein